MWYLPMRGSQVWAGDNHSPFTKTHRLVVLSSLFQPLSSPSLCWSQLPIAPSAVTGELGILPVWGANIFCRDSFNPLLGILLVVSHSLTALHPKNSYKDLTLTSKKCASKQLLFAGSSPQFLTAPWVSLGHCSWKRERQRLPAAARGLDE